MIIGPYFLVGELKMFGFLLEILLVERQLAASERVTTQFSEMTKPLAPARSRRDAHALQCTALRSQNNNGVSTACSVRSKRLVFLG